jgi:hypothetical protein
LTQPEFRFDLIQHELRGRCVGDNHKDRLRSFDGLEAEAWMSANPPVSGSNTA